MKTLTFRLREVTAFSLVFQSQNIIIQSPSVLCTLKAVQPISYTFSFVQRLIKTTTSLTWPIRVIWWRTWRNRCHVEYCV